MVKGIVTSTDEKSEERRGSPFCSHSTIKGRRRSCLLDTKLGSPDNSTNQDGAAHKIPVKHSAYPIEPQMLGKQAIVTFVCCHNDIRMLCLHFSVHIPWKCVCSCTWWCGTILCHMWCCSCVYWRMYFERSSFSQLFYHSVTVTVTVAVTVTIGLILHTRICAPINDRNTTHAHAHAVFIHSAKDSNVCYFWWVTNHWRHC